MKVQNKSIRSRQGFTLVEMLGVLAIIAILISVIAVGVLSAINRARIVATVSNLKNVETGVIGYSALSSSGGTVPLTEGAGTTSLTGVPNYDGTTVTYVNDGSGYTLDQVLISTGLLERPLAWRVGADGTTVITQASEPKFISAKRAYSTTATGSISGGAITLNTTGWPTVNRVESAITDTRVTNGATDLEHDAFVAAPQFLVDGSSPVTSGRVAFVVLRAVSLKDAQKLSQELNGSLDNTETTPGAQLVGRFIFAQQAATDTTVDCYYYIAAF